jgi:hypothetical protein
MGQSNVKKTTIFDVVGNIAPPSTLLKLAKPKHAAQKRKD